jgi:hypothetical protein
VYRNTTRSSEKTMNTFRRTIWMYPLSFIAVADLDLNGAANDVDSQSAPRPSFQ